MPVSIFQSVTLNQGIPTGVGNIFNEGGYGTMAIEQSRYSMLRGDVTWYKSLKGTGSHEFQTGFLLMPRNYYRGTNVVIDPSGLTAESVRLIDPNNINSGTVPLDRTFQLGALELVNTEGRDRDLGSTCRTRGGRSSASP